MEEFNKKRTILLILILAIVVLILVLINSIKLSKETKIELNEASNIESDSHLIQGDIIIPEEVIEEANKDLVLIENMNEIRAIYKEEGKISNIASKIEDTIMNIFNVSKKSNNIESFFNQNKEKISQRTYIKSYEQFKKLINKVFNNDASKIISSKIKSGSANRIDENIIIATMELTLDNNNIVLLTLEIDELTSEIKLFEAQKYILEHVNNTKNYFTVDSIISNYITCAGYNVKNELLNILSKEYIKQYGITNDNVLQKINIEEISNEKYYYKYNTNNILFAEQEENIKAYLVNGEYRLNSLSEYININVMVLIDEANKLYEIYPEEYLYDKGYLSLKEGSMLNLKDKKLSENSKQFSYITKNDKDISKILFNRWSDYILYNRNKAFNKLNTEYKDKKYNTEESFIKYISNNKFIPTIDKYIVYKKDNYADYICTDQYGNYYIFRQEDNITNYSVFLDSYTVELDYFKEMYDNSNINDKVGLQINKFKQMINSKDFNSIYNKLNTVFKNNNYSNISELESYLKNNIYNINNIEINTIQKSDDYYICNCRVVNLENENQVKNMNIIIKLIDSNNFEMSFSFE